MPSTTSCQITLRYLIFINMPVETSEPKNVINSQRLIYTYPFLWRVTRAYMYLTQNCDQHVGLNSSPSDPTFQFWGSRLLIKGSLRSNQQARGGINLGVGERVIQPPTPRTGCFIVLLSLIVTGDRLCGFVVRVPGYTMEMYCVSCEV
jgi:hypothetical protein